MVRQLDGAGFALDAASAYAKTGGLELLFVFLIDAVVAVILFGVVFASTNRMQARAGYNFQTFLT